MDCYQEREHCMNLTICLVMSFFNANAVEPFCGNSEDKMNQNRQLLWEFSGLGALK